MQMTVRGYAVGKPELWLRPDRNRKQPEFCAQALYRDE
jgi:hypothetical protein